MISATQGKLTFVEQQQQVDITLKNGELSTTVDGKTYTLKQLANNGNSLILARTDESLLNLMNEDESGPVLIWTFVAVDAQPMTLPTSGQTTYYSGDTDNFGDDHRTTKNLIDWTNKNITPYSIDGNKRSDTRPIKISADGKSWIDESDDSGYYGNIDRTTVFLMDKIGDYHIYREDDLHEHTRENAARGKSTISSYLSTVSGDLLWSSDDGSYARIIRDADGKIHHIEHYEDGIKSQSFEFTISDTEFKYKTGTYSSNITRLNPEDNSITYIRQDSEILTAFTKPLFTYTYENDPAVTYAPEKHDIVITDADLALPEKTVTFKAGETWTLGNRTITMTSATEGIIQMPGRQDGTISIENDRVTLKEYSTPHHYKVLTHNSDALVLAQTDKSWTEILNQSDWPYSDNLDALIALKNSKAVIDALPSGKHTLYHFQAEEFGDKQRPIKSIIDFDTKTITGYSITGKEVTKESFSTSNNTLIFSDGEKAHIISHSDGIWVMANETNQVLDYGKGKGAANISDFLKKSGDQLWDNDTNDDGIMNHVTKVIRDGSGNIVALEENLSKATIIKYPATLNSDGKLEVTFPDGTDTYEINHDTLICHSVRTSTSAFSDSPVYEYQYATKTNIYPDPGHAGEVLILHEGADIPDLSLLSYKESGFGATLGTIDAKIDNAANSVKINISDVLELAPYAEGDNPRTINILGGSNDTIDIDLAAWKKGETQTAADGTVFNTYTADSGASHLMLAIDATITQII